MNTFVLKVIHGVKNYRGRNAEVSPRLPHRHSLPKAVTLSALTFILLELPFSNMYTWLHISCFSRNGF